MKMMTKTTIYKNHGQQGHYYVVDEANRDMVEIVQGSEIYIRRVEDFDGTYELLMHEVTIGIPGWTYEFKESTLLDILVVTGVTEEEINEAMEVPRINSHHVLG